MNGTTLNATESNVIENNIKAIEMQIAQLQGALQVWIALRDVGATVSVPAQAAQGTPPVNDVEPA